jgi:hypothetical protein
MLLHQPCSDSAGERFDKETAGGGFSLQFGRNGAGDLGQQWIFESAFMFQRADRRLVYIDSELIRGELVRREIKMQDPRKIPGDIDRTFAPTRRREPGRTAPRDVSIYDACRPSRDE